MGALVAGALLRFWDLDQREIWYDEAISVDVAMRADSGVLSSFVDDNKPPLYAMLLRGWIELFGVSEIAVRSLSGLCGLLTIVFVWLLARELLGDTGASIATLLFAMSPLAVHYGREARNYSLLMLLVTASLWLLERALREPRAKRWWVLYALALAATIFTHYHAGVIVLVHAIQVVSRRPVEWKRWGVAVATVAVAYAPWLPVFLRQLRGVPSGLSWLGPFWREYPPALAIPRSMLAFVPGGDVPPFVGMATHAALQPLVGVAGIVAIALALIPSRVKSIEPRRDRATVVLLAALLVPLAAIWVVSVVLAPVYAVGRADTHVLPVFCLLLASGIERIRSGVARNALAAALLALGLATIPIADRDVSNAEKRRFEELRQSLHAGDLVICAGYSGPSAAYYLEHSDAGSGIRVRHYPENFSGNPSAGDPAAFAQPFLLAESEDAAWQAEQTLARGRRVLVLGTTSPVNEWLVAALERRFRLEHLPALDYGTSRAGLPVFVLEGFPY